MGEQDNDILKRLYGYANRLNDVCVYEEKKD